MRPASSRVGAPRRRAALRGKGIAAGGRRTPTRSSTQSSLLSTQRERRLAEAASEADAIAAAAEGARLTRLAAADAARAAAAAEAREAILREGGGVAWTAVLAPVCRSEGVVRQRGLRRADDKLRLDEASRATLQAAGVGGGAGDWGPRRGQYFRIEVIGDGQRGSGRGGDGDEGIGDGGADSRAGAADVAWAGLLDHGARPGTVELPPCVAARLGLAGRLPASAASAPAPAGAPPPLVRLTYVALPTGAHAVVRPRAARFADRVPMSDPRAALEMALLRRVTLAPGDVVEIAPRPRSPGGDRGDVDGGNGGHALSPDPPLLVDIVAVLAAEAEDGGVGPAAAVTLVDAEMSVEVTPSREEEEEMEDARRRREDEQRAREAFAASGASKGGETGQSSSSRAAAAAPAPPASPAPPAPLPTAEERRRRREAAASAAEARLRRRNDDAGGGGAGEGDDG